MKKVIFVTEYLNPPYDEGIKKTVYNLFLYLDDNFDLQVICRYGFEKDNIEIVESNVLYFSRKIKSKIQEFNPDSLIYLPFQSSTFASYLRLKVLNSFSLNNNSILIALQPKPIKLWQEFLLRFLKPNFAFTPSPTLNKYWNKNEVENELLPLLTDLKIFKPLDGLMKKSELRKKYDLPIDSIIVSHMGHLNEGRNLRTLIPIQSSNIQIVIVASSSTPEDAKGGNNLKEELEKKGVMIIDRYIENIQEIYHLSDIYVFPVVEENSSIGMPLSVLEARACGLPVVTTKYGSLNTYLGDDSGGIFYSETNRFLENINKITANNSRSFINSKVASLNKLFFTLVHNKIQNNE